jgi:hypothetical protein
MAFLLGVHLLTGWYCKLRPNNEGESHYTTPVHVAAVNGHAALIKPLLAHGYPADFTDRWGLSTRFLLTSALS